MGVVRCLSGGERTLLKDRLSAQNNVNGDDWAISLSTLHELGASIDDDTLDARRAALEPESILTIIYKAAFSENLARLTIASGNDVFAAFDSLPGPRHWASVPHRLTISI